MSVVSEDTDLPADLIKLGMDIRVFASYVFGLAGQRQNQAICDFVFDSLSNDIICSNHLAAESLCDLMYRLKVQAIFFQRNLPINDNDFQRLPDNRTTRERLQDKLEAAGVSSFKFLNDWCAETDEEVYCLPPTLRHYDDALLYLIDLQQRMALRSSIVERKLLNSKTTQASNTKQRSIKI